MTVGNFAKLRKTRIYIEEWDKLEKKYCKKDGGFFSKVLSIVYNGMKEEDSKFNNLFLTSEIEQVGKKLWRKELRKSTILSAFSKQNYWFWGPCEKVNTTFSYDFGIPDRVFVPTCWACSLISSIKDVTTTLSDQPAHHFVIGQLPREMWMSTIKLAWEWVYERTGAAHSRIDYYWWCCWADLQRLLKLSTTLLSKKKKVEWIIHSIYGVKR